MYLTTKKQLNYLLLEKILILEAQELDIGEAELEWHQNIIWVNSYFPLHHKDRIVKYKNTSIGILRMGYFRPDSKTLSTILPKVSCPTKASPNAFEKFIDNLYVENIPLPNLKFKNGKLRQSTLNLIYKAIVQNPDYPSTIKLCTLLTDNWETLSEDLKFKLTYRYKFNTSGEYTGKFKTLKIWSTSENLSYYTRVNPDLYRPINPIFEFIDDLQIETKEPLDYSINFDGNLVTLSKTEYTILNIYYKQCSCGTWDFKENFIFNLCSKCTEDIPMDLHPYHIRATDYFSPDIQKSKYPSLLLGVELEFEFEFELDSINKKEALFLLNKEIGTHAIFKKDGSLANGVEICTKPASIPIHLKELNKIYNNSLLMERLKVKDTCGMHVHIDKKKLSYLSIGKIINFVQKQNHKSFIEKLAERPENRYTILGKNTPISAYFIQTNDLDSRYNGVNTTNDNTIEIRIFKTPSTFQRFQKNMEFVIALVEFSTSYGGINDLTIEKFNNFVIHNRGVYSELHKFLSKGL